MSFIIMNFSLTYYIWVSLYHFASFGLKMTLWLHVRYCQLLDIWYVFIVDMLNFFSFVFLILFDKKYRNITMPNHTKISGYTLKAVAKMLTPIQVGLSGHIAHWKWFSTQEETNCWWTTLGMNFSWMFFHFHGILQQSIPRK